MSDTIGERSSGPALPATRLDQIQMEVTAIIVSYNTRELTLECIASIYDQTKLEPIEVRVVDNASSDGSAQAIRDRFPEVHLYDLDENLGFGRANNLAALDARGRFIVLVNPDTRILDGAIESLVRYARTQPDAGLVGGRTLREDGSLNPSSCWGAPSLWSVFCRASCLSSLFPRTRMFDPTSLGRWKRDSEREVGVVSGCFVMASADDRKLVGMPRVEREEF